MKKLLRYLVLSIMALAFCLPAFGRAEAATVALLPLVNNVQDDELASQVFYKEAMAVLNSNPGIVLVENDKLLAAIEANKTTGAVPGEAVLAKIAKDGDVDVVIAMQLDVLNDEALRSSEGDRLQLDIQGYAVAYNRLTGEYYNHRIYNDDTIPEVFSSRWDVTHEEWGKAVRYEVRRILKM